MPTSHLIRLLCTLCVCVVLAPAASADERYQTTRGLGLGGQLTAGSGAPALFHNPAALMAAPGYHVDAGYLYQERQQTHSTGFTVVDMQTNPNLAGGLSYQMNFGGNTPSLGGVSEQDARVGLAAPLFTNRLAIGFGGRWVRQVQGNRSEEIPRSQVGGITLDLGGFALLSRNVAIAAAAQNLRRIEGLTHRTVSSGIGLYFPMLFASLEWQLHLLSPTQQRHNTGGALEGRFGPFSVRSAVQLSGADDATYVSAGFGWREHEGGFDVGFRIDARDTGNRQFGASLTLLY